ncbi:protein spitz-like isoform X3 [Uloborus diversus]|nr:protein spitz-like isoform X3 [Uloborus diversus]XP_054715940.1 protein spitz-like isoform X3 [Uloborus diversus]
MVPQLLFILLYISTVFRIAESCSSRSTPKPRPTSATMRPNITFQTYACPEAYAKWYCLNGATCFAVKIRDSILYNCECADGYMGQRCEFKDLDGSYLPSRERVMIERASIAGGVTIAVLLVVLISLISYIHMRRRWRRKYIAYYQEEEEEEGTEKSPHPHLVQQQYHLTFPIPEARTKRNHHLQFQSSTPQQRTEVATISQSRFLEHCHPQQQ